MAGRWRERVEKTLAGRCFCVRLEVGLVTPVHTPLVDVRLMATPNTGMCAWKTRTLGV